MRVHGMHLNKTIISILVLTTFLITGCTKTNNSSSFMKSISNDSQIETYDTEMISYKFQNEYQNTSIQYPKLKSSLSIPNLVEINELIKIKALELGQFDINYEDNEIYEDKIGINYLELTVGYEIKYLSESHISVTFQGFFNPRRAPHGTHLFYTLNIDLRSAKCTRLIDMVNVNKKFLKLFKEAIKNRQIEPHPDVDVYFTDIPDDEILKYLKSSDNLRLDAEDQYDVFSYFTEKQICIAYPVPYGVGNHTVIKVDIEKLNDD